jgi:plasmid maintenance system antidote protein VapI
MRDEIPANTSPADLRAAIARSGAPAYVVGARCRINPIRLSRLLRGHDPITAEVAVRILTAVQREAIANGR